MQEELAGNGAVGLNSETAALHDFGLCCTRLDLAVCESYLAAARLQQLACL